MMKIRTCDGRRTPEQIDGRLRNFRAVAHSSAEAATPRHGRPKSSNSKGLMLYFAIECCTSAIEAA
jgi:hypothetical protein